MAFSDLKQTGTKSLLFAFLLMLYCKSLTTDYPFLRSMKLLFTVGQGLSAFLL